MANVSFSLDQEGTLEAADGSDITEGTSAPGAGALEVRIDSSKITNLVQLNEGLEKIYRFAADNLFSTSMAGVG